MWVGPYTILDGSHGKLLVGDFVSINAGVMVYTHDSTKYHVSGGKSPFEQGDVVIKDHTVVGTMSMVGCNVTVGRHCVVGAHSFVNQDLPDFCIAAGVPARVIGKVILDEGNVRFEYF